MNSAVTTIKHMCKHEQKFREAFPKCTIESQKGNSLGRKRYYLVRRDRLSPMWSGCGNTKQAAWRDACIREFFEERRYQH